MCDNSYFDSTKKICVAPTTLSQNADNYSTATTIQNCNDGYYLNNNTCTPIPMNNTNCTNGTVTSNVFTCNACALNYYLEIDNNCYQIPSSNNSCLTGAYNNSSVFVCSTCQSGYYLDSNSTC